MGGWGGETRLPLLPHIQWSQCPLAFLSLPASGWVSVRPPPSLLVTDLFPAPDKGNSARQPEAPEYSSPRPPSWALKTRRNVVLCVLAADMEGYLSSLGVGGTF